MKQITKKEFFETITSNESEFLSGGYYKTTTAKAIKFFGEYDYSSLVGEKRQASKHSNGLKFLKTDGSYSYLGNLVNYVYFKKDNILIIIDKAEPLKFIGIYRVLS